MTVCNGQKKCSKCGLAKNTEHFHKSCKSSDGYKPSCKECVRVLSQKYHCEKQKNSDYRAKQAVRCKQWREHQLSNNPDFWKDYYQKYSSQQKTRAREYYKQNRETVLVKYKKRRSDNIDKYLESSNRWKRNHGEQYRAKHREWIKNNAEHVRNYNRKKRALKRGAQIQNFTDEQLYQRMSVFGFRCAYCGGTFDHVDHVIPLKRGGKHCLSNLRPACSLCNLSKHDKKLSDWLEKKKRETK
jgi:hypothetical protein